MASNALKQLIADGDWGALDYLLIDLPPGTSDIHLTLVQTIPVTGVIIVTTPQDVALADALKGVNMFQSKSIDVPVLGIVENMSWFTPAELPGNKYYIFGKEGGKDSPTTWGWYCWGKFHWSRASGKAEMKELQQRHGPIPSPVPPLWNSPERSSGKPISGTKPEKLPKK